MGTRNIINYLRRVVFYLLSKESEILHANIDGSIDGGIDRLLTGE